MIIDKQISYADIERYKNNGYYTYRITNRTTYSKEGKWIRTINRCLDILQEAALPGEVILAEVFDDIRRVAKVKREGKARNPGKRTVKSVRMVTVLKGEHKADLVVISKEEIDDELINKLKIEAVKIAIS